MGDDILSNNPASLESTSNDKKVQINHRKILRMKRARIVMVGVFYSSFFWCSIIATFFLDFSFQ